MSINFAARRFLSDQIVRRSRAALCANLHPSTLASVQICSINDFGCYHHWTTATSSPFRNAQHRRFYSTDGDSPLHKVPKQLTNFPEIVWPSLFKSFRVFLYSTFLIKPYMDNEFTIPDFVKGSKKAVEVVSKKLSEGDLKTLEGLVTKDILPELRKAVSDMSLAEREELAINIEDIYFSFPYQIGVIFEEGKSTKRFVEITMVYHIMRGLAAMRNRGEEPPINLGGMPEYQNRLAVCNYRFIKEFTKGEESGWTINLLNHFKPADVAN